MLMESLGLGPEESRVGERSGSPARGRGNPAQGAGEVAEVWVGVDGGGTGTRVLVVGPDGSPVGEAEAPPAGVTADRVPHAVGLGVDTVRSALVRARIQAPVRGLCAGLAGGGREAVRRELEGALASHGLAKEVQVVADAEAAHHDAFAGGPSILLTAGTGSVAWARDAEGRAVRVGGWGPLVGDEGSGYVLSLTAVRAVLRAHDGRGAATALTASALDLAGLEEPQELVDWAARESRAEVAELARIVMEEAEGGDSVARELVDEAAAHLAAHLDAVLERLEGPAPGLAFGGGLLLPGTPLRRRLEAWAERRGLEVEPKELRAARGAAHLALHRPPGGT